MKLTPMQTRLSVVPFLLFLMLSCSPKSENTSQVKNSDDVSQKNVSVSPFGKLQDGSPVSMYTLTNAKGATMKVINYGGIIVSLEVPDKNGNAVDVVLGYDSLEAYEKRNPFFGALVGRYGNRIEMNDGKEITLHIYHRA